MQFYEKLSKETENKIRQEKADNSFRNFGFDKKRLYAEMKQEIRHLFGAPPLYGILIK